MTALSTASPIEAARGYYLSTLREGDRVNLIHEARDGDEEIATPLFGRVLTIQRGDTPTGSFASIVFSRHAAEVYEKYPDIDLSVCGTTIVWFDHGRTSAANCGGIDGLPACGVVRVADEQPDGVRIKSHEPTSRELYERARANGETVGDQFNRIPTVNEIAEELLAKEPEDRIGQPGDAKNPPRVGMPDSPFTSIMVPTPVARCIEAADRWRDVAKAFAGDTDSEALIEAYNASMIAICTFIGVGMRLLPNLPTSRPTSGH